MNYHTYVVEGFYPVIIFLWLKNHLNQNQKDNLCIYISTTCEIKKTFVEKNVDHVVLFLTKWGFVSCINVCSVVFL